MNTEQQVLTYHGTTARWCSAWSCISLPTSVSMEINMQHHTCCVMPELLFFHGMYHVPALETLGSVGWWLPSVCGANAKHTLGLWSWDYSTNCDMFTKCLVTPAATGGLPTLKAFARILGVERNTAVVKPRSSPESTFKITRRKWISGVQRCVRKRVTLKGKSRVPRQDSDGRVAGWKDVTTWSHPMYYFNFHLISLNLPLVSATTHQKYY